MQDSSTRSVARLGPGRPPGPSPAVLTAWARQPLGGDAATAASRHSTSGSRLTSHGAAGQKAIAAKQRVVPPDLRSRRVQAINPASAGSNQAMPSGCPGRTRCCFRPANARIRRPSSASACRGRKSASPATPAISPPRGLDSGIAARPSAPLFHEKFRPCRRDFVSPLAGVDLCARTEQDRRAWYPSCATTKLIERDVYATLP